MRFFLFEDSGTDALFPLALTRPVFELICGRESLRRRVQRWFPRADWGARVRPWLQEVYREEHPDSHVNDLAWLAEQPVLMMNGRWMPERHLNEVDVTMDNAGFIDGHLTWIALAPEEARLLCDDGFHETLLGIARSRRVVEASGIMIRRPWDLVNHNGVQLDRDFMDEGVSQISPAPHVQCLGDPGDVYISEQSEIDPYVVIDARHGPVSIDRDVQIQSFTRIEGPCHITRGTKVFRALIHGGTTIGATCRAGGEIENSILHACVNKYHEGFLGHSYICPWVNIGAISSTSDLKNDYTSVQVPLQGELIDSGLMKVGSFIGDHTKTAIDSMFNVGSSLGVMTVVLPGGRLLPRNIPSFCNVSFGELAADWPLEKSIETARQAMARRDCELTPAMATLFRTLYDMTADERTAALNRAIQNRISRT
ncbi:MAG: putative sugar nucleotidyl transferase [Planctomycetaceae bacterium]